MVSTRRRAASPHVVSSCRARAPTSSLHECAQSEIRAGSSCAMRATGASGRPAELRTARQRIRRVAPRGRRSNAQPGSSSGQPETSPGQPESSLGRPQPGQNRNASVSALPQRGQGRRSTGLCTQPMRAFLPPPPATPRMEKAADLLGFSKICAAFSRAADAPGRRPPLREISRRSQ
jgi:hypothetical protein